MSHIFFSYSRKDSIIAKRLVNLISGYEFEVWQDVSAIEGGQDYMDKIFNDISSSAALIVLWSENAAGSQWVNDEINHALADRKQVIPLQIDKTPLTNPLKIKQGITVDPDNLKPAIAKIIKVLPPEAGPQWRAFKEGTPWWQQALPSATPISGTSLFQVHLRESWCCDVYAIGTQNAFNGTVKQLALCLQFTGAQSMVPQVYTDLKGRQVANGGEFAAIYFVSKVKNDRGYTIDPEKSGQWLASLRGIEQTVPKIAVRGTTLLQVCVQAPSALMAAFGRSLDRFWLLEVYHFVLPTGPYLPILEVDW